VQVKALHFCLLHEPLLNLHHDLLLKNLLLAALHVRLLRLFRRPTALIPLVDHLNAKLVNLNLKFLRHYHARLPLLDHELMLLLQLLLLLLVDTAHLLNLLHRGAVHVLNLLLDQGFFRHLWLRLLMALLQLIGQLLVLCVQLLLLKTFARFLTILMRARVPLFVPTLAAAARLRHESDRHLCETAVLLVDGPYFL
jgi:hypothetical protein